MAQPKKSSIKERTKIMGDTNNVNKATLLNVDVYLKKKKMYM